MFSLVALPAAGVQSVAFAQDGDEEDSLGETLATQALEGVFGDDEVTTDDDAAEEEATNDIDQTASNTQTGTQTNALRGGDDTATITQSIGQTDEDRVEAEQEAESEAESSASSEDSDDKSHDDYKDHAEDNSITGASSGDATSGDATAAIATGAVQTATNNAEIDQEEEFEDIVQLNAQRFAPQSNEQRAAIINVDEVVDVDDNETDDGDNGDDELVRICTSQGGRIVVIEVDAATAEALIALPGNQFVRC